MIDPTPSKTRKANWRSLARLVYPYRHRWVFATLALVTGGLVNLSLPQFARIAVDEALTRDDTSQLDGTIVLGLGAFFFMSLLLFIRHYLMSWLGHRVVADLRERCFRQLMRHPPGFFETHKSGALVSRLTSDIQTLQHAVGSELSIAMRSTMVVLGGVTVLAWTNPNLTLLTLATIPVLVASAL